MGVKPNTKFVAENCAKIGENSNHNIGPWHSSIDSFVFAKSRLFTVSTKLVSRYFDLAACSSGHHLHQRGFESRQGAVFRT
jgi:hypothetical protein